MNNHQLIIFDATICLSVFKDYSLNPSNHYFIFSLTSNSVAIHTFKTYLHQKGIHFTFLNSAQLINEASQAIRSHYIQFFASIHESLKIKKRTLREWFAIDQYTSLWWFSLVSERNTYKSNSFNCLAQLHAIIDVIQTYQIQTILVGFKNEALRDCLFEYSNKQPFIMVDTITEKFRFFKKQFYFFSLSASIFRILRYIFHIYRIKIRFQFLSRKKIPVSVLIQTYYPNINQPAAQQGIFKNNFYQSFQEGLEAEKRHMAWLAMYVPNSGVSFHKSMQYATNFIKHGYPMYFLEEFISGWHLVKAFFFMLKSGLIFLFLKRSIQKVHQSFGYSFFSIFEKDWYESFVGFTGFMGLIYYDAFKSAFLYFKPQQCVYLCEMHAWEKALCAARATLNFPVDVFGYQNGTISYMLLNYFSHPHELRRYHHYSLPIPDKVVCNGQNPFRYMLESGWKSQQVYLAEAVRYDYLKAYLHTPVETKESTILVAFSISPKEASSMLNIVYEAFQEDFSYEVWLKTHPFLHISRIFKESSISKETCRFSIKEGNIENFLKSARIVIVGESGVSLEALALGCEVIIINVADWINMSPLQNIQAEFIHTVHSATELKDTVQKILEKPYNPNKYFEKAKFILNDCFCLNMDSDYPSKFMNLLKK